LVHRTTKWNDCVDCREGLTMDEKGEFVIRRHHAKRAGLHDDLHLDGESWAIPKLVPTQINRRVLAIKTTFHTPEQARFEGTIPDGSYGAGTCEVVDEGEVVFISSSPTHIFFQLHGNHYTGNYYLRRWEGNKWLLWKKP